MCRSDSNFTDAKSFRPERWLRQTEKTPNLPQRYPMHNRDTFHPFGFGNSKCPGDKLAYMMMRLILAKLLWHFDFSESEALLPWETQTSGVLVKRRAWGVCLTMRREELEKQRAEYKH